MQNLWPKYPILKNIGVIVKNLWASVWNLQLLATHVATSSSTRHWLSCIVYHQSIIVRKFYMYD